MIITALQLTFRSLFVTYGKLSSRRLIYSLLMNVLIGLAAAAAATLGLLNVGAIKCSAVLKMNYETH